MHPRTGGGDSATHAGNARYAGSSPPVRGNRDAAGDLRGPPGSIPARGEKHPTQSRPATRSAVHPPARGEGVRTRVYAPAVSGSSPRVRGTWGPLGFVLHLWRCIPARAGYPTSTPFHGGFWLPSGGVPRLIPHPAPAGVRSRAFPGADAIAKMASAARRWPCWRRARGVPSIPMRAIRSSFPRCVGAPFRVPLECGHCLHQVTSASSSLLHRNSWWAPAHAAFTSTATPRFCRRRRRRWVTRCLSRSARYRPPRSW